MGYAHVRMDDDEEISVSISKRLVAEFAHEAAITRRMLEMVPKEHLDWAPDANSMSLSHLAGHVAQVPCWISTIMTRDGIDLAEEHLFQPLEPAGLDELLVEFGSRVGEFHLAVGGLGDDELEKPWTLRRGPQVIAKMTRAMAIRRFILGHLVHHRGQLSVYLWMLGVPIPAIYSPMAEHRDFTVEESEAYRESAAEMVAASAS